MKVNDTDVLNIIQKIHTDIKSGLTISEVLDTVLVDSLSLFSATTGSISIMDPENNMLTIVCARGIDKDKRLAANFPLGVGITGTAAASKEVIYIPDVRQDKRYVKLIDSVITELAIPMMSNQQILGVLNLESDKPDDFSQEEIRLASILAHQLALILLENRFFNQVLSQKREERDYTHRLLGYDPQILFIKSRIRTVAPSDAPVFIFGESGTGKELVARSVHELSNRQSKPFIALNCGALNENLLESELFGYTKGAFTGAGKTTIGRFEAAHGGTLFLDEVGEMTPALQVKLLRALQEGEIEKVGSHQKVKVDVRIISATHRNLLEDIEAGTFRLDLYFRLSVIPIQLPPLRDRKGDITILAHHFLMKFNERYGKNKTLSQEAIEGLAQHNWVGNVRELENAIQYAAIISHEDIIYRENLPETIAKKRNLETGEEEKNPTKENHVDIAMESESSLNLDEAVQKLEARYIKKALELAGSQRDAAELLGISRGSLQYKIKNNPFLKDLQT